MNKQELTFELLQNTGLNWEVNKEPLFTEDGRGTESFGMFRSDNKQWLGTVGNGYVPLQNWELAEMLIEAGQQMDLDFTRGGELKDGRLVYLQTKLPDAVIANDTLKRQLTALNSHNGTTSIGFGTTNTVVVCQNTFHMALRGMNKFRHSLSAKDRILALVDEISAAIKGEETVVESMQRMAEIKIQQEPFERVMNVLFGKHGTAELDDVPTRTKNNINKFAEVMESEIASHGNSLWGLFNAVTFYTNHIQREQDMEYLMNGGGYKTNTRSFNEILKWVTDNTGELVTA